jgi:hypothetical protein
MSRLESTRIAWVQTILATWPQGLTPLVVFPLPVENGPGAALLFLYLYKIPLAVEAQSCRGRPTIFAIFLAKFVSVALSLSGFTVGFAVKTGCAIVLQVKEYFYRLEQISTPLGIA